MTREKFKARLAVLEEHRRFQQPPTETMCLFFVDRCGSRFWCNIARGPSNFICRRLADESLEEFQERACEACLDTKPKVPIAGLIFSHEEVSVA
jgi:hypothetical protein